MKNLVLFFKSHIDTFTRKDGSVVAAHDDKRQAHMDTLRKFHEAHVPDSDNHLSHVPDHKMRQFDKEHIAALKESGHIQHGDITNGDNEYDDRGHSITAKGKKALSEKGESKDGATKKFSYLGIHDKGYGAPFSTEGHVHARDEAHAHEMARADMHETERSSLKKLNVRAV